MGAFVDEFAANAGLETDVNYYFPSVIVDRNQLPDKVYALFSGRHQGKPQSIRSWFQLDAKGAIKATYADTTVGTADAKRTWAATYTKQ